MAQLSCSANAAFALGSYEAPSDIVPGGKKWEKRPSITLGGKKGRMGPLLLSSSSWSAKQKIFQSEDHKEATSLFSHLPLRPASRVFTPRGRWVGNLSQTEAGGSGCLAKQPRARVPNYAGPGHTLTWGRPLPDSAKCPEGQLGTGSRAFQLLGSQGGKEGSPFLDFKGFLHFGHGDAVCCSLSPSPPGQESWHRPLSTLLVGELWGGEGTMVSWLCFSHELARRGDLEAGPHWMRPLAHLNQQPVLQ